MAKNGLGRAALGAVPEDDTSSDHDDDRLHDLLLELSHDLRHPSATIRALAAALEIEVDLSEQAKTRLAQIVAEAWRIDEICLGVLDGNRDEVITRLDNVAREVASAARAQIPGIEFVSSPVVAPIDALSARRVLWNLLDNASRAAGPEGRILVAVWSTSDQVILEVGDDGPGFGNGLGGTATLGLTIVSRLVERFGGRITVGCSDLGGACVRVVLPLPTVDLRDER